MNKVIKGVVVLSLLTSAFVAAAGKPPLPSARDRKRMMRENAYQGTWEEVENGIPWRISFSTNGYACCDRNGDRAFYVWESNGDGLLRCKFEDQTTFYYDVESGTMNLDLETAGKNGLGYLGEFTWTSPDLLPALQELLDSESAREEIASFRSKQWVAPESNPDACPVAIKDMSVRNLTAEEMELVGTYTLGKEVRNGGGGFLLAPNGLFKAYDERNSIVGTWRVVQTNGLRLAMATSVDGRFSTAIKAIHGDPFQLHLVNGADSVEGIVENLSKDGCFRLMTRVSTTVSKEEQGKLEGLASNMLKTARCAYQGTWRGSLNDLEVSVSLVMNNLGIARVGKEEFSFGWTARPGDAEIDADGLPWGLIRELKYDAETGALDVVVNSKRVRLPYIGSDIHPRLKRRLEMQKKLEKAARER